jgi:hypothetical protein
MWRLTILCVVAAVASFGIARAAGPYDGNWTGEASGATALGGRAGACTAPVTATVDNNILKGSLNWGRFTPTPFSGTIALDGSFKSQNGGITGKFAGNSFQGGFSVPGGSCNPYRLTLTRS